MLNVVEMHAAYDRWSSTGDGADQQVGDLLRFSQWLIFVDDGDWNESVQCGSVEDAVSEFDRETAIWQ